MKYFFTEFAHFEIQ